jgi:hypothetical protein
MLAGLLAVVFMVSVVGGLVVVARGIVRDSFFNIQF